MIKYIIVHCKHNGCYDYGYYEEEKSGRRIKPIVTINPPKIFLFDDKAQAKEFFDEYINDVDVLDERCVKGENISHVDYCTCGIVELDEEDGQPIFFYNHRNQIFLLETGPQLFVTPHNLKINLNNMNLTNSLIKKSKYLGREQKLRYIELGNRCQQYLDKRTYFGEPEEEVTTEVEVDAEVETEEMCQPCTTTVGEDNKSIQENQDSINIDESKVNINDLKDNEDEKASKDSGDDKENKPKKEKKARKNSKKNKSEKTD